MPKPVRISFVAGGTREVQTALRSINQSLEAAERRRTRTTDRSEQDRVKATDKAERARERIALRAEREQERLAKAEARAVAKGEQEKLREIERFARQRDRIQTRSAELAFKLADAEVRAEKRKQEEIRRIRERSDRTFGRTFTGGRGSSMGGRSEAGVGLIGGLLTMGSGFVAADAIHRKFSLEKQSSLLANAARGEGAQRGDIEARARAVSIKTGIDAAEIAGSMKAYFDKASDFQGAMENAPLFAKLAKASGADVGEVGKVAGMLRVQNPKLSPDEMKNLLLGIVGQGKAGAVDFAELASSAPVITSTSGMYGGKQSDNQRKLLGLSQVAIRTAGDAAEAATTVSRFGQDVASNASKMEAGGVKVRDEKGGLLDPAQIIANVLQQTKGDLGAAKHLGFGKESIKLLEAELPTFKAGGKEAVVKDIEKYEKAGYTPEELEKDFAEVMETSASKFEMATNKIALIVEERLAPYLDRFADKLPEILPAIALTVDAFAWMAETAIDAGSAVAGFVKSIGEWEDQVEIGLERIKKWFGGDDSGGGAGDTSDAPKAPPETVNKGRAYGTITGTAVGTAIGTTVGAGGMGGAVGGAIGGGLGAIISGVVGVQKAKDEPSGGEHAGQLVKSATTVTTPPPTTTPQPIPADFPAAVKVGAPGVVDPKLDKRHDEMMTALKAIASNTSSQPGSGISNPLDPRRHYDIGHDARRWPNSGPGQ
jgi:hypothetical protein